MNPSEQTDVPQGYLPPPSAYEAAIPRFTVEGDPLVNDSRLGLGGWFHRLGGVLRRGRPLVPLILGITHVVPGVLLWLRSVPSLYLDLRSRVPNQALAVGIVTLAVLALMAQLLGYAAATYAATRQAAGYEVRLGEALRYGLCRCLGLTGWTLLAGLLAGGAIMAVGWCSVNVLSDAGVIAALPVAAYALPAIAMVGPAYIFERRSPITRSLHLLHGAFSRMLGRLLLIGLVLAAGELAWLALSFAVGVIAVVVSPIAAAGAAAVLTAIIELSVAMLVFSGILVTYAERVGDEGRTTTDLAGQL